MKISSRLIAIVVSAIVIVASLTLITSAVIDSKRQGWNMDKAERHIALIEPAIRADARFEQVRLMPYTRFNGCLRIEGHVSSEQVNADLLKIIKESHPPVPLDYEVFAIPEFPQ
ncbi:hypothetical protein [Chthoniobacter flavus]|uniref:hypothetical protein n=1 Tax=Chthoniobacter flavus TaxID=191863 RepID=UPI001046604D|nr:hypothetical protein [Chthoniobacter flavus]